MDINTLEKILIENCKPPARIAVLGSGNYLRADDFLGVTIIQNLKEQLKNDSILLLEAETAANEFFPTILEWKPTHLIIIDAADFKAEPGTFNLIKREKMVTYTLTSHKRALTLLIDLTKHYFPDLKFIIIGIQPETIDFKIGLSHSIKETVQKLTKLLISVLSCL
ncbi:MAG: hydrogenase maturation protease [Promethearchaeota archaeon]